MAFELGQLTEMVRFARAGLGTAIVPRSFTAELAAARRRAVGVLGLTGSGMAITIGAYTRSEAPWPAPAPSSTSLPAAMNSAANSPDAPIGCGKPEGTVADEPRYGPGTGST